MKNSNGLLRTGSLFPTTHPHGLEPQNRMKKSQYRIFTSHGEHYGSWYVCEERIPMSEVEEIVNNLTGEVIWRREGGGE